MEVEYTLKLEELWLIEHIPPGEKPRAKKTKRGSRGEWVIFVAGGIILFWLLSSPYKTVVATFLGLGIWFLIGLFLGAIGMFFIFVRMKKVLLRGTAEFSDDDRNRWLFEPQRLRLHPQALTINSASQQLTNCWSMVWKIDVTEDQVCFYTTTKNGHIVPRRAFRDQQHFEEFVVLARQYQQGFNQQGPQSTGIVAGLPPQSTATTRPDVS
jgi:YcxB-like protein